MDQNSDNYTHADGLFLKNMNDLYTDSNVADKQNYSLCSNKEYIESITPLIMELIENDLADYEKVALVFLLYKDARCALETLKTSFTHGISQSTPISSWARVKEVNWQFKLVEALAIIKNYKILENIGLSKSDIDLYFPMYSKETKYIDRIIKELYVISDNLSLSDAEKLSSFVEKDIKIKIKNNNEFQFIEESRYLEICFLKLLYFGLIVNDDMHIDLSCVNKILKKIDKLDKADELDDIVKQVRAQRLQLSEFEDRNREDQNTTDKIGDILETHITETPNVSKFVDRTKGKEDNMRYMDRYKIYDNDNVGLCIVVNQMVFDQDCPHKLENRWGSQKDAADLKRIFEKKLKMRFVLLEDLPSHEILKRISHNINSYLLECHSMIFLFVLSHGSEGYIYGTDCKPVLIKDLEDCLTENKMLCEKPKILIVQACQNNSPSTDITTDGHSGKTHFMKCMATLPGLLSNRSKTHGTWYIQSLCETINKHMDKKHFSDIITIVQGIIKEKCNTLNIPEYLMIPKKEDTLTKNLYLKECV